MVRLVYTLMSLEEQVKRLNHKAGAGGLFRWMGVDFQEDAEDFDTPLTSGFMPGRTPATPQD